MSRLIQLKKQIKAIQATRKITHAVRLVSMSLYSKLEKQHNPLQHYINSSKKLFVELVQSTPTWKNKLSSHTDPFDTAPLFIIVATSKGLCGSLNSNLFRFFEQSLFVEEQQNPKFITIGQKATRAVKSKALGEIICSYNELNSNNYTSIANDLADKIINSNNAFSSVTFYSNFMKTFFIQRPQKTALIPLAIEQNTVDNQIESPNYEDTIWEQDRFEVLDYLATMQLRSSIMYLLFQSLLAEQTARFIAMDNSTTHADKFLEKLILQFNKQRQALITREVAELSTNT